MQIAPTRTLFYREFCGFIGVSSQRVFRARFRPCKQPRPRLHPHFTQSFFLIWCSRTLQWRGFSERCRLFARHGACWHAGRMASDLVHHGQSFDDQPLGFGTLAIHLGNGVDAETGAIRRPITLANAYALPYDASALAIAKHLESLDVVRFVAYPGLESHLHHEVAPASWPARLRVRRRAVVRPRHRPRRAQPIRFQAQCDCVCRLARP